MDFPIAGPNVNPCNMVYWTYRLTYIYVYIWHIYVIYYMVIYQSLFINQQLGPGILWKLGEVVVLSTLLTVLEQQSTRWSQANKTKELRFFFESGMISEAFLDSGVFSIFFHLSRRLTETFSRVTVYMFSKPRGFGVTVQRKLIHQYKSTSWDGGSPTVDGSEIRRSPPAMYKTLWIMGQTTYQLVQNVFHQQYCAKNWSLFTHKAGQQFLSVQFSTCFPIFLEKCSTD